MFKCLNRNSSLDLFFFLLQFSIHLLNRHPTLSLFIFLSLFLFLMFFLFFFLLFFYLVLWLFLINIDDFTLLSLQRLLNNKICKSALFNPTLSLLFLSNLIRKIPNHIQLLLTRIVNQSFSTDRINKLVTKLNITIHTIVKSVQTANPHHLELLKYPPIRLHIDIQNRSTLTTTLTTHPQYFVLTNLNSSQYHPMFLIIFLTNTLSKLLPLFNTVVVF